MVDIQNVTVIVSQKVGQLEVGGEIELKTYKRDRGATIIKLSDDNVRIREKGYLNTEYQVPVSRLKKALKNILKKEFPRSNKVRFTVKKS